MSDLYALVDKAGVVKRVIYSPIEFDDLTPYHMPDGYWIGDVRMPDGSWQHPVVLTEPSPDAYMHVAEMDDGVAP